MRKPLFLQGKFVKLAAASMAGISFLLTPLSAKAQNQWGDIPDKYQKIDMFVEDKDFLDDLSHWKTDMNLIKEEVLDSDHLDLKDNKKLANNIKKIMIISYLNNNKDQYIMENGNWDTKKLLKLADKLPRNAAKMFRKYVRDEYTAIASTPPTPDSETKLIIIEEPEEEILTQKQSIIEEEEPVTLPATTQKHRIMSPDSYDYGGEWTNWDRDADTFTIGINTLQSPNDRLGAARHGWSGRRYTKIGFSEDQTVVTPGENPGDDPVKTTTTITEEFESNYEVYLYVDSMTATSYSYYGYWLAKASNLQVIADRPFYGYGGPPGLPDMSTITTGTATYTGDVAGLVDIRSGSGQTGPFDADITLTANFATDKIKGTINNFSGLVGASGWSIELKETDFDDDGIFTSAQTIWTIDGVAGSSNGSWKGDMLGTSGDHPQDIVGGFYAEHTGSYISGAFGAEKQ